MAADKRMYCGDFLDHKDGFIRSEEGRPRNLLKMSDTVNEAMQPKAPNGSVPNSHSGNDPSYYWKKQEAEKAAGRELSNAEFEADWYEADAYVGGTSIFDPVLRRQDVALRRRARPPWRPRLERRRRPLRS